MNYPINTDREHLVKALLDRYCKYLLNQSKQDLETLHRAAEGNYRVWSLADAMIEEKHSRG